MSKNFMVRGIPELFFAEIKRQSRLQKISMNQYFKNALLEYDEILPPIRKKPGKKGFKIYKLTCAEYENLKFLADCSGLSMTKTALQAVYWKVYNDTKNKIYKEHDAPESFLNNVERYAGEPIT